jgi:hypothetical protein
MLITIIGLNRDQVRMYNKELHDSIHRTVKSRMLWCMNHVAKIGNTKNAYSRPTQPAACLQATCSTWHAVCGDMWNEKTSFKSFPGKAEIEWWNILKTYELFIYGDIHSITNSFCKNVLKMVTLQSRLWPAFFYKCFLLPVHLYST